MQQGDYFAYREDTTYLDMFSNHKPPPKAIKQYEIEETVALQRKLVSN